MIRSLARSLLRALPLLGLAAAAEFWQPDKTLPNVDGLTNRGTTPLYAAVGWG